VNRLPAVFLAWATALCAADLPQGLSRFNPAGLAANWTYEGTAFREFLASAPDTHPVYRLRHPQRGYVLAASAQEKARAEGEGFIAEGTAFQAPLKDGVAVHRFKDSRGRYFYAIEREPPPGNWAYDGEAFRASPQAPVQIARYRDASGQYLFTGARESPYQVGAFYFGSFSPSAKGQIDGTARVHGRKDDWWGGVSDFYGKEPGIPADRRGWSGEFEELKPAIGYYNQQSVDTLEKHIRQASDAGLAFFSFYWYWSNAKGAERFPEALQSFLKARNPTDFKFNFSLYAHPWEDDMAVDPVRTPGVIDAIVGYFADPRYLRLPDGRPVFAIGDLRNIRDADGRKCADMQCNVRATERFIEILKRASIAKIGVAPFVQMQPGPGWEAVKDADGATCQFPPVDVRGGTPYPHLSESMYAPWVLPGKPLSPCMMENFDERPRQDVLIADRSVVRYFVGKTDTLFRENLAVAKHFSDAAYAKEHDPASRIVYLYAWNEWHEGGILEPNATTGAHDLNIVTDVFGLPRAPSRCLDQGVCEATR
jgi:Glycosyltransferase WbsX